MVEKFLLLSEENSFKNSMFKVLKYFLGILFNSHANFTHKFINSTENVMLENFQFSSLHNFLSPTVLD